MTVPLDRQIACILRELAMRRRVYPNFVTRGTMTQTKADQEIADMQAVLATLQGLDGRAAATADAGAAVMHATQQELVL